MSARASAAYGWHVEHVNDANDLASLDKAFAAFCSRTDAPTLIIVDSHIGYGAPHKQDTAAAHGEPLGDDEIRLDQAQLRLAGGRAVPRARRRARAFRRRASASAAPSTGRTGRS